MMAGRASNQLRRMFPWDFTCLPGRRPMCSVDSECDIENTAMSHMAGLGELDKVIALVRYEVCVSVTRRRRRRHP